MTSKKYLFAGNRIFVLEDMLDMSLDVTILTVRGSHLERGLPSLPTYVRHGARKELE